MSLSVHGFKCFHTDPSLDYCAVTELGSVFAYSARPDGGQDGKQLLEIFGDVEPFLTQKDDLVHVQDQSLFCKIVQRKYIYRLPENL